MLKSLQNPPDDDMAFMAQQMREMVQRYDAIQSVSALDKQDLRGWHYVISGGVLLHLSPYGFNEGMNGRYAYTQDSPLRIRESIERLRTLLSAWEQPYAHVISFSDEPSQVLAQAVANVLQIQDVHTLSHHWSKQPGLLVAYDLATCNEEDIGLTENVHPGQCLFQHAATWLAEPLYVADCTTYLYQHNINPWQARMRINPVTQTPEVETADERSIDVKVKDILSAQVEAEQLADLPALVRMAESIRNTPKEAIHSSFRTMGLRRRQRVNSPVRSSYFV